MALTHEQIDKLLGLIGSTQEDDLDCDGCLDHIAEFADVQLANRSLPDALQAVQQHLESCACCADEYQALLDGLHGLEQEE